MLIRKHNFPSKYGAFGVWFGSINVFTDTCLISTQNYFEFLLNYTYDISCIRYKRLNSQTKLLLRVYVREVASYD